MKTVEELYNEIMVSNELMNELAGSADLSEFLKKHDCNASAEEFASYVTSQYDGELDDDDVGDVAGGSAIFDLPLPYGSIPVVQMSLTDADLEKERMMAESRRRIRESFSKMGQTPYDPTGIIP